MSDIEDYDDEGESQGGYKPSFVLIAIDTHPSMFVKSKKEEDGVPSSPFQDCLKACHEVADSLLFCQNRRSWSSFAVVLTHEDASKASLVNFKDNVTDSINILRKKSQLDNDTLADLYQRKGPLDLSMFFLFCKKKFKEINSLFYRRTIIFVTNDDNPTMGDKDKRFTALNEVKNFEASSINFEMVTMNPEFNYKVFYNELFSILKTQNVENLIEDADGLVEKLSNAIIMRYTLRKVLFFPFKNDEKRFLKLVQKKLIREAKLYNNAFVSKDGTVVKKIRRNLETETGFIVKHSEGCEELDIDEHEEVVNNGFSVGYTLLCTSKRMTDIGVILGESALIEPDQKEDLTFFNQFWQYCVDNDKVLICARKLREKASVRFVEFIPKFANNSRCFLVKSIGFSDEFSYPSSEKCLDDVINTDDVEKTEVINQLIETLSFDYDPKMFANPAYVQKKLFLKSKLLDVPQEQYEDVTLDSEGIDSRIENLDVKLKNIFDLEAEGKGKRKMPGAPRGRPKKVKT